jgi:hypothetical protein
MNLRDFVRPILVGPLRKILNKQSNNMLFNSYESAIAGCKPGYEEKAVVMVVYEKTKKYRGNCAQQSLRILTGSLPSTGKYFESYCSLHTIFFLSN